MTAKIYRWGFVAAGRMAKAMAADLAFAPRCAVGGVVSRTERSGAAFVDEFGGKLYASLAEMLVDPAIDLIYVSSPNNLHYSQVKLALEAGKPVLCEKPFTLNAAELQELISLARAKQLFLMEAMWVRWLPIVVKLRELLQEGAIGQPFQMHASFHSSAPKAADNRFYNPELGGGALLDLGIYPISYSSMIFGSPAKISGHARLGETHIDEHFGAVFGYTGGRIAMVSAGIDGRLPQDITLIGTMGTIRVFLDQGGWQQTRLQLQAGGKSQEFDLPFLGRGYTHQALEVVRCLDAGELESPTMPLDESLSIMRILDELRSQWGMKFPGE